MNCVLITGATGMIGQKLVKACLGKGLTVHYLTSSKSKIVNSENYNGFYWDIKSGEIDVNCFKNVDTIFNLVGASIAKRWTVSYKKEIVESRTKSAKLLITTLKSIDHSIKQIISASAVGIYKSSLTNYYQEDTNQVNKEFLGEVVSLWEEAIDAFNTLNLQVAKIRIGLVLSNKGGVLDKVAKPIKMGAGAAFGSGNQWQSWIHVNDLVDMFLFIRKEKLEGVFNGVAPNPVTNTAFTNQVAEALNKSIILPNIPKFVMKLSLGEMHQLLFESQRVSSSKIEGEGFQFKFPNLKPALLNLLS